MKERLDVLVVQRGLAPSREKAKALIMAGVVLVNDEREDKAGSTFPVDCEIRIKGTPQKYVSRGGYKLEKALEVWPIDLTDRVCMEQTNVRYLTPDMIPDAVTFVSIDVAFISLTKVLLPIRDVMEEGAEMAALVKPQFEAGREKVGKKGVVRDPKVHLQVLRDVTAFAAQAGFAVLGLSFSPIRGPEGNIEYLMYLRKEENPEQDLAALDPLIRSLVEESHRTL